MICFHFKASLKQNIKPSVFINPRVRCVKRELNFVEERTYKLCSCGEHPQCRWHRSRMKPESETRKFEFNLRKIKIKRPQYLSYTQPYGTETPIKFCSLPQDYCPYTE